MVKRMRFYNIMSWGFLGISLIASLEGIINSTISTEGRWELLGIAVFCYIMCEIYNNRDEIEKIKEKFMID